MTIKAAAVRLLLPVARGLDRVAAPLARLWAHVRLRARLGPPFDPSVVVLGVPEVHGTGNVSLGRGLYLYPGLYLETREAGLIEVGDGVVMSRGVHLVAFSAIHIGAGSMLGEYASVRDANHRVAAGVGDGPALRHAGHDSRPIRIGREVWIGRGVTVLPGVTIGDGAVIGANAVVTADIPAGAVAVGVPARVIRLRDDTAPPDGRSG